MGLSRGGFRYPYHSGDLRFICIRVVCCLYVRIICLRNVCWGWNIQAILCKLLVSISILNSHGEEGLIIPRETGSMHSLAPGLAHWPIISYKYPQYIHIQVLKKAYILHLIIFNTIILCCVGPDEIFTTINVILAIVIIIWLIFILGVGAKRFLFIIDEDVWIIKNVLRRV